MSSFTDEVKDHDLATNVVATNTVATNTVDDLSNHAVYSAVAETIRQRRTIKQFLPQPVPRSVLQELIDLAVWAPNHRLTEPWRFYVLDGAARSKLGVIAAQITVEKIMGSGGEIDAATRKGEEAALTWSSVPTLLYVTSVRDANPEIDQENYGAVCCALQNLALAAHAADIGTSWSSGAVAMAPALHELVGAGDNEQLVGLIRVGFLDPAIAPPKSRRKAGSANTTWVDSE
jgi:nitroreductase